MYFSKNTIHRRSKEFPKMKLTYKILRAMWRLGCTTNESVTTQQIARRTRLKANVVSRTLGNIPMEVDKVSGKGSNTKWVLKNYFAATL